MENQAAREMTLVEVVNDLPPNHQARREFAALITRAEIAEANSERLDEKRKSTEADNRQLDMQLQVALDNGDENEKEIEKAEADNERLRELTCCKCGRSLAPDGDCHGCRADRLEKALEAVKRDRNRLRDVVAGGDTAIRNAAYALNARGTPPTDSAIVRELKGYDDGINIVNVILDGKGK